MLSTNLDSLLFFCCIVYGRISWYISRLCSWHYDTGIFYQFSCFPCWTILRFLRKCRVVDGVATNATVSGGSVLWHPLPCLITEYIERCVPRLDTFLFAVIPVGQSFTAEDDIENLQTAYMSGSVVGSLVRSPRCGHVYECYLHRYTACSFAVGRCV